MMARWLAYIWLFDFDMEHIHGTKNGADDALSRHGRSPNDELGAEDDADNYFDAKLYDAYVSDQRYHYDYTPQIYLHEGEYEGDNLILGQYLESLQRPDNITYQKYQQWWKRSRNFLVCDGYLFKHGRRRNIPPRRVVGSPVQRHQRVTQRSWTLGMAWNIWQSLSVIPVERTKMSSSLLNLAINVSDAPLCVTKNLYILCRALLSGKGLVLISFMMPNPGKYQYIVFARSRFERLGWRSCPYNEGSRERSKVHIRRRHIPTRMSEAHRNGRRDWQLGFDEGFTGETSYLANACICFFPQSNGLVESGHNAIVNVLAKYNKIREMRYLLLVL